MDVENLPTALRALREARNLSQAALAARIRESTGVRATASRISRWEGGEEMPSVRSLFALLHGMQANLHDLADALELIGGGEPLVDQYLEGSGKLLAASAPLRRQVSELAARVDGLEELADRVAWLEARLDHDDETS